MAPLEKDEGGSGRRKSMNLFSRGSHSNLIQLGTEAVGDNADEQGQKKERKKLGKRNSLFGLVPTSSQDTSHDGSSLRSERSNSFKQRPRTLQKGRPASIFGSLGKRSMYNVEEGEADTAYLAAPESPPEDAHPEPAHNSKSVLHHGEVQTTSGMFRKKKEYLVLTETHLLRFKSQSRASETFSCIPPAYGRATTTRHPSMTSIGSLQESQSNHSHASNELDNHIPLGQIVTAYKVEDGRPFFTTEVVYLDEEYHGVGSIQLILHDPKEADLWHTSIRAAAQKARLLMNEPYPERVIRYLVHILEGVADYDADHFQVFRVAKRGPSKGGRSSDDLQKLGSSVFYMVVGINRLHLIPLPDFSDSSSRLNPSKASRSFYGFVTLVAMNVRDSDDRFELGFRLPLQQPKVLELAASATLDIAAAVCRSIRFLKPQWLDYTFYFNGPKRLLQFPDNPSVDDEEYGCFDRTLVSYCMAYNCNPANIQYAVDWEVEDAPEFRLYPPTNVTTPKYSAYELLAIMRSLRYNEAFTSISFKDIDLHPLYGVVDQHGEDHIAWFTRAAGSGISIQRFFGITPQDKSLLYQEIQAIALKSRRLKRLDFTNALPRRRPKDTFDTEAQVIEKDPGSEIVAAILPLCRAKVTNVTWIVMSGIELGETDLDDIIPAFNEPEANLRALECSHSGLNDRGINQIMGSMERQSNTLECINISDNPGRVPLERFQIAMSRFSQIRKLDFSRITRVSGEDALILPEVMMSWRLEQLILNGIPMNDKSLDAVAAYLASDMSEKLRVLEMDQCNLNGSQLAVLMRSMTRKAGEARNLQLHVSANRLEKGVGEIVSAIEENFTPSHLVIRMIEFTKEDHFKRLLQALRTNTTIRSLDVSKASLPYDASPETCDALQRLFSDNQTLEDLDISGEHAHLEVTRFGIGLNQALTGLKRNKALKSLRIEYQNLGMEGANTLSSVIEENTCLTRIYCEHNDINLQGFTILVNALAKNYTLLDMPLMQGDQGESMKRMSANMRDSKQRAVANGGSDRPVKSSVRRTLTVLGVSKPQKQELSPQDIDEIVRVLGDKWTTEIQRLSIFLDRNRNFAAGIEGYGPGEWDEEMLRPTTALSDGGIMEQVLSHTTPKVELENPIEEQLASMGLGNRSQIRSGGENERKEAEIDDQGTPRKTKLPRLRLDGNDLPQINSEKMFNLDTDFFDMKS